MKDSRTVFVWAIVFIIIGIASIGVSRSINIPSAYNTFLGIPYQVNPEFVSSFNLMIELLLGGCLFLGFGLGMLGTIGYVLRLEKKIPQAPPPP